MHAYEMVEDYTHITHWTGDVMERNGLIMSILCYVLLLLPFFGGVKPLCIFYLFIYFLQLIRCERAPGSLQHNPRVWPTRTQMYKLKQNKIKRSKCKNISVIIEIVAQNRSCNRCALLQLLAQWIESNRLHFPHHHQRIMITENAHALQLHMDFN